MSKDMEKETLEQNEEIEEIVQDEAVEEKTEVKKEKKKGIFSKKDSVEELKLQIEELKGENAQLKNEYAKAYADTENTRKRLQQEFESRQKYRIQSFATEILPALDNLERALAQETTPESESYVKGVEMIYQQLIHSLKNEGVEEIEALDQPYDHNWHQALMTEVKEGVEPNQVTEVLQKGYKLKDRILRPAMVKVSE